MRATRKLLEIASTNIHKSQLVKPRSHWDTVSSAFATVVSLVSSQNDRDKFIETVDKGIINPSILGKADMGVFMTFALHHDLNNDLFKRHDFQVEEFMEGAEPALESFQETLYSLDKSILPAFIKNLKEALEDEANDAEEEGEKSKDSIQSIATSTFANSTMTEDKLKRMEDAVLKGSDWKKKAEEEPDSLYAELSGMISDQLLKSCESQFVMSVMSCYMNKVPRMSYELETGKISDIALLSCRAHEIVSEVDHDENKKNDDSDVMVDESLEPFVDKKYPVAAQIEVIYSISQTFAQTLIEDAEEKETDEGSRTMETAWVAVFEGMLFDGNNGSEEKLRWKLVDNRPAWEFGMSIQ